MKKLQIAPKNIKAVFINKSISNVEKEVLFRKALIDYPDDEAGILHLLMITLDILGKNEECIEVCNRIIPLLKDKFEIGFIYYFQGKKYLILNNKDKAFEQFTKAVEVNKVMEAGIELARIYKEKSDWDNVIKAYDSIECIEKERKLEKLLQKGIAYTNLKEFDKAIVCYKKYLEIKPNHLGVMGNLELIYCKLEKYDECIESLVKRLKIDPKDAVTYFNLGNIYYEKNDYHMSMNYFKKAIKLKPDYTSAYINLGSLIFEDLDDAEKGLEYLIKAMDLNIEDNITLEVLYKNLINVYTKLENTEKAAYYKIKLDDLRSTTKENSKID